MYDSSPYLLQVRSIRDDLVVGPVEALVRSRPRGRKHVGNLTAVHSSARSQQNGRQTRYAVVIETD